MADRWINRTDAEALIPEEVVMDLISGIRKESVAMNLLRRLPNMSTDSGRFDVLDMLPRADFVEGNAGMKPVTKAAWDKKKLVVGEIAAIVAVPDAIIDDASYDLWGHVRPLLIESMGRVFDEQVFNGGNPKAPTEWPDGLIPQAVAAGNAVPMGNGQDVLEDLTEVFSLLEENDYDVTGLAAQKRMRTVLRKVRDANGGFLFASPTSGSDQNPFGVPMHFVGRGTWDRDTALAIAGEWDNAVYSLRQDVTFTLSNTAVLNDEDGRVWLNSFQQDCTALRAVMRVAWQVANPIGIDRVGEDGRMLDGLFPFAVLQPAGN